MDILQDYKTRSCYSKLRISAHNLQIEIGRYGTNKTPREKRYCLFCQSSGVCIVEDEVSFLMECPLYSERRKVMLDTVYGKYPSTKPLNNKHLFIWLMSQEDTECIQTVGNYLKHSFIIREKHNWS